MAATMAFIGCASVPLDGPKMVSSAPINTDRTQLAQSSADWRAADPQRNGFYPLLKGFDAFGARLKLMDRAEHSIDAQYFLMKPDYAGLVFAEKLMQAADRGVRVRFLLDDIFTTADDRALILLNENPNIEMRLFNPIARKGVRAFNYIGNFKTANRRMHNKSFTVDNQAAIVGGRNIAEEYFQLDKTGQFIDFDMLCAGPIVKDISAAFDTYWNHELAVPMDVFYGEAEKKELEDKRNELRAAMQKTGESIYKESVDTELMQKFFAGTLDPYMADARVIIDAPQKLLEDVSDEQKVVIFEIVDAFNKAQKEIVMFTPYFIPGKGGVALLKEIAAKGVRVMVVTNSLATNNHTSVHSAYASYRKRILKAGVELYEVRANAAEVELADGTKKYEHLTMHTKGILIDRRYTFVGSLNLDWRSTDINTEMGVMIESEELAGFLADNSIERLPKMAYQLKLDDRNNITWHATIDGKQIVETKEPQTSAWLRFKAWFLKLAPEKQL
jgi:putative cardiolipin synthase